MVYKFLGLIFVLLAFLGLFLPILPTTPFLLVAAACFSKSSKKWHNWLLNHRIFGNLIQNWEENRSIPRRSKILALSMILLSAIYSIALKLDSIYLQIPVGALFLYAIIFVARIKVSQ